MAFSAADVPGKFDVWINGRGYVFLDALTPNIPFRTHRATYSYSPTFIERTNVSAGYGDSQQAFWLTYKQNDWSLGEQLKYFRTGDPTASRRYWYSNAVDIRVPGEVTLRQAVKSVAVGATVSYTATVDNSTAAATGTTNLFYIDHAGTVTNKGAHGLGAAPSTITGTAGVVWLSTETAGTVGVRRYDGTTYSTFSATSASELAYLNNTLFGLASNLLVQWDTAGVRSTIYTWRMPDAGAYNANVSKLRPYGGKLAILRNVADGPELWIYDGTAPAIVAKYPANFYASTMEVALGTIFVGGVLVKKDDGTNRLDTPAVFYYANGAFGKLWDAGTTIQVTSATSQKDTSPALAGYDSGLVFNDETTGRFLYYNPDVGGFHSVGSYTVSGTAPQMAATQRSFFHVRGSSTAYVYPDASNVAATGKTQTAAVDFESSLTKLFRGITIDADIPSGATVDIAYQLDGVGGTYTTLRTAAASGVEYTFPAATAGRSISAQVTLNKGTSAAGPTHRRVYVRGAPLQQTFPRREYILDLTGAAPDPPRVLRDGSPDPTVPFDGVTNLIAAATSATPFSITDRLGTFTGIIEPDGFEVFEMHAQNQTPAKSGSYVVKVTVRGV